MDAMDAMEIVNAAIAAIILLGMVPVLLLSWRSLIWRQPLRLAGAQLR
jgi:hypothetical protein